jgi:hypothetical protein
VQKGWCKGVHVCCVHAYRGMGIVRKNTSHICLRKLVCCDFLQNVSLLNIINHIIPMSKNKILDVFKFHKLKISLQFS